jgi:hypothetical protein
MANSLGCNPGPRSVQDFLSHRRWKCSPAPSIFQYPNGESDYPIG